MSTRAEAVRARVEEALARSGLGSRLDLEAVELSSAGRRRVLRVAVDQDGGVRHDDLVEVEDAVSAVLEESDVMGEQAYTLEVTSRGVDRPLSLPRHWRRNRDRLVEVTRTDGSRTTGRVVEHDEDPGGGVRLVDGERELTVGYADIDTALVQVEFSRRDPGGEDD